MANSVGTNPIVIDSFGADVTLCETAANITSITFTSPGADHCILVDRRNNVVVDSRVAAGSSDNQFIDVNVQGLIIDVSQGSFTAGARLLVYLE